MSLRSDDQTDLKFPVVIEWRKHPFPFRTRQLSSTSPMILRGQLCGKVGRRRDNIKGPRENTVGLFLFRRRFGSPEYQFTETSAARPRPIAGAADSRGPTDTID